MKVSPIVRRWFSMSAAVAALAGVSHAQQVQYSHGDPTALEQQMLEYVNRARANPTQEGVFLDTIDTWYSRDARARKPWFFTNLRAEFAAFPAAQPLAFHPMLIQAARAHSQDMVARNYLAHVNTSGQTPTMRGAAAGYDTGVGENIDGGGASSGGDVLHSHFAFMVDYDNLDTANPLGHRYNVMTASYTEAGIGISGPRYGGRITQDFGSPARSYIVGAAYSDTNANGRYDAGEGLAGITVRPDVGNWFAVTSTSGGFAIPIDPVQTVSDTVNVPFPVQGDTWPSVQPYDAAYRQQQLAAAPTISVDLTWTGGALASPIATRVVMKRPVLRNYRLMGTDGWFYTMSMVTTQNAKADLTSTVPPVFIPSTKDLNRDGLSDLVFQNDRGEVAVWMLNGTAETVDFASGSGLVPGSKALYGGLGDWKVCASADINSDGNADLLFQNKAGQIFAWFLDGTGNAVSFTTGAGLKPGSKLLYAAGLGDWRLADAADINGDGIPDLLLQNNAGQIYVWFLDGSGNAVDFATGAGLKPGWKFLYASGLGDWRLAKSVDMNGDGKNDLVFQDTAGQIGLWFLDGSGNTANFSTGAGLVPASSRLIHSGSLGDWKLAACPDLNNDGTSDLVFQNAAGQVAAWTLDGTGNAVNFSTGAGLRAGSGFLYVSALGDWKVR